MVSITLFLYWRRKLVPKKFAKKGKTTQQWKSRTVVVSRSNFWLQMGFSLKDENEKFDNSEKFAEKQFDIFCFICLSLLTLELSNINWKCSENYNMFTESTYDRAVVKIFLNITTTGFFIEIVYEILSSIHTYIHT